MEPTEQRRPAVVAGDADAAADADTDRADEPIRGHIRTKGHRRVSHGLFLKTRDGLDPHAEWLRDLHAWRAVLPETAVFTHLTAARLYGWQLPRLPEQVPVFAAVARNDRHPRRAGLVCSRLVRPVRAQGETTQFVRGGLAVDLPEEVLLSAARDLSAIDLQILVDSAVRCGDVDQERMATLLASRRPGVRKLRVAYAAANPLAESAGESLLRTFHEVMEVPVQPQVDVHGDDGQFLGRGDLLVTGTTTIHEYDGAGHRSGEQHRADLRRARGLSGSRYDRRGFTLDDLLNHAGVVMHELDRLLGRSHDPRRLRRWRQMVAESMYSEAGRARMLNRWARQMGVVEWSLSA